MMNMVHPTNMFGMEMTVIAAIVLGGTSITGGTGTLTGTILGIFLFDHGAEQPHYARRTGLLAGLHDGSSDNHWYGGILCADTAQPKQRKPSLSKAGS